MATSAEEVVAAHGRRLARLDPLLPRVHPLPAALPDDAPLVVDGGVGIARRERPDPDTMEAIWGAAEQHRLLARVAGPDPVAAMAALLARWRERVADLAAAGDPDSEAALSWPSRDAAMTRLFLAHGLVPSAVVAARPAGRPVPEAPAGGARVRELADTDLDAALALWREVIQWDSQFGTVGERPGTPAVLRRALQGVLARDEPWAWVAEVDGNVNGLLLIDPPAHAGWVSPLVTPTPTAYLGTLVVTAGHRGDGLGAALTREGHRALDAAGVDVTLLHYSALNPLSGPFWHRCGYRPLWTGWHAHPASRLTAPA